jgi:hypothetical protein
MRLELLRIAMACSLLVAFAPAAPGADSGGAIEPGAEPDSQGAQIGGSASAVEAQPAPAEGSQGAGVEPKAANPEELPADAGAAPEAAAAEGKPPEPVTGAFGIPLGERFTPDLVAKVLREGERTYRAADKEQRIGTRYWVEPKITNPNFMSYGVDTTADGIIYAIWGEHEGPDRSSKCDLTKKLAAFLEHKYGKPRGKGAFGEWYSFRDMSVKAYRGIRLYANRCRRGIYSIVYSDDNVRLAQPATEPATQPGSEAQPEPAPAPKPEQDT